jgi:flagellar hook-basal body complex protein FliE
MSVNNLSIENLSKIIETGDAGAMLGRSNVIDEANVVREMQRNGMSSPGGSDSAVSANTFSDMFRKSIDQVNKDQVEADTAIKAMVSGRNKNIHETMLAVERADTSLKLMMQVRNKVLDAYREIMRMQV